MPARSKKRRRLEALAVGEARPTTTKPVRCPHFGPCGGCDHLDLFYREEIARKEARLAERIQGSRLGGFRLHPIRRASQPLFYRRVVKVPFARTGGRVRAGIFRRGSHGIVDLQECAIQDPLLTRLVRSCRSQAERFGVPIYSEHRHRGLLRWLVAKRSASTGEVLAGLVVRRGGAPQVRDLGRELFERFSGEGLVGIVENIHPDVSNAVLGRRTRPLFGATRLREEFGGVPVEVSLPTFLQVHAGQAELLAALVTERVDPQPGRTVLDLFAGCGPFALRFALSGASVLAVESAPSAVRDGADAARAAGLAERIAWQRSDAERAADRLASEGRTFDVVVADPPRKGLGEGLIRALGRLVSGRFVYVSCNPDTFVRDAESLLSTLRLVELLPVDLFPRTSHLELVGVFEPR